MERFGLSNKINLGQDTFENEIFSEWLYLNNLNINNEKPITLTFAKCTFNKPVEISHITNSKLSIVFIKCKFTFISSFNLKLDRLCFHNILELEKLQIYNSTFYEVSINNNIKLENSEFNINSSTIRILNCNGLKTNKIDFRYINTYPEISEYSSANFMNSEIDKFHFNAHFKNYCSFQNMILKEAFFVDCIFNEISFDKTKFGLKSRFYNCNFTSKSQFMFCSNNGALTFTDSLFENFSYFNESKFNQLNFKKTIFKKKVSFDRLTVNILSLYQTTFSEGSFFDELKIKNISDKEYIKSITSDEALKLRRTLRQVKQELQKAENRIDYNRFRGYELQAYYQELDWKNNFKDKAILLATKASTGFEHSWTKALRFVLTGAAIFYTLFFISENYMQTLNLNLSSIKDFVSGYFRFLIVTDFYNPLEEKRIFIDNSNTLGWVIFILGKIVLAFGIYEMIQAFRKFKA